MNKMTAMAEKIYDEALNLPLDDRMELVDAIEFYEGEEFGLQLQVEER